MKTVCIDIDGTICHFINWQGPEVFGDVLPGAVENIRKLKESGCFIIIYTTRADKHVIAKFLSKNGIPYDAINENPNQPQNAKGGKPIADVYIDDRNVSFNGNWTKTYKEVMLFKPWEEKLTKMEEHSKKFMSDDFTQCMYMLRHYDSMNWEITKYAVTEMLVAVGACWSIYNWQPNIDATNTTSLPLLIISVICIASFLFGLLSLFLIGKNRCYFALTSRHINEYRKLVMDNEPLGFENKSKYWCNIDFPKAFDTSSTQMFCFYLLSIFSIFMLGVGLFTFLQYIENPILWIAILLPLIMLIVIIVLARLLMKDK